MPSQKTQQRILGRDWVQITEGETDGFIQVYATVEICRSPTKPDNDAPCLQFCDQTITILAPDIAWARAAYNQNVIINIW